MADLALAVAELTTLAQSPHPLHRALFDLYQCGEIEIVGTRNGQIVWQIPSHHENNV
jgi:hypothetical protein